MLDLGAFEKLLDDFSVELWSVRREARHSLQEVDDGEYLETKEFCEHLDRLDREVDRMRLDVFNALEAWHCAEVVANS
jgi:hypothetical protein